MNLSEEFNSVVNKAFVIVDSNKVVYTVIGLFLALYAALAAPVLPASITKYFKNTWFKLAFMFLIGYIATKNASVAIISSVALLVTLQTLASQETTDTVVAAVESKIEDNIENFQQHDVNELLSQNANYFSSNEVNLDDYIVDESENDNNEDVEYGGVGGFEGSDDEEIEGFEGSDDEDVEGFEGSDDEDVEGFNTNNIYEAFASKKVKPTLSPAQQEAAAAALHIKRVAVQQAQASKVAAAQALASARKSAAEARAAAKAVAAKTAADKALAAKVAAAKAAVLKAEQTKSEAAQNAAVKAEASAATAKQLALTRATAAAAAAAASKASKAAAKAARIAAATARASASKAIKAAKATKAAKAAAKVATKAATKAATPMIATNVEKYSNTLEEENFSCQDASMAVDGFNENEFAAF